MKMQTLLLAVVASVIFPPTAVSAETTANDLTMVSGREFLRLCVLRENARPCLQAIYASATVNRLLDAIKKIRRRSALQLRLGFRRMTLSRV